MTAVSRLRQSFTAFSVVSQKRDKGEVPECNNRRENVRRVN
jgi:hypothetical protein